MKMMYDGTGYHGWQIQNNGHSVQAELEQGLLRMSGSVIKVVGSGRTDAGVHALEQTAHFDFEGAMQPYQMVLALRNLLSDDLRVFAIEQVEESFHARYDACERQYKYLLAKDKNPFTRNYMGFVPNQRLDLLKMQHAAPSFLGIHDFSSFSRANPNIPNRICNLKELSITEYDNHFEFILKADRFLHNMVRRIVGALISISHQDLNPDIVAKWFADASPRQNLVFTTPASGLYLTKVLYNDCKKCNVK